MAPLVPNIISPEFNFVIALLVGIGFGFALEQAGFSSTRKLVGLFYGYDFTVLKVFFTAGVTAMTGVVLLSHLGLLNLEVIYVNPTFLSSAIVGGLIMGAGFIIGGFCPGTSLCAAAVGRLDAFAFILGSVIGIFIFMEGFGAIEPLFNAQNLGALRINEVLNISPEMFGISLTIIAIVAFYFTTKIENHINQRTAKVSRDSKFVYASISMLPILIIVIVWITPSRQEYLRELVVEKVESHDFSFDEMDIDELAFELSNHAYEYNLIDVRDTASFKTTLPSAINIPYEEMDEEAWRHVFKQPYKKNIFVADSEFDVQKAAVFANILGDDNPIIFTNTVSDFREAIFNPIAPDENATKQEEDEFKFRENASFILLRLEQRLKNLRQPVKKIIKKVEGGCT